MGHSCCVTKKHDMMAEMDNRKKRATKADKQLVAGVGADDNLIGSSQNSTQDNYGGIDVHGMQQDHNRDSLNIRQSLVDSYMANSTIEPRMSDAVPNATGDPSKQDRNSYVK